jgi:hypothetical protein
LLPMVDYLHGIKGNMINTIEEFKCSLNRWFVDSRWRKITTCQKKCIPSNYKFGIH